MLGSYYKTWNSFSVGLNFQPALCEQMKDSWKTGTAWRIHPLADSVRTRSYEPDTRTDALCLTKPEATALSQVWPIPYRRGTSTGLRERCFPRNMTLSTYPLVPLQVSSYLPYDESGQIIYSHVEEGRWAPQYNGHKGTASKHHGRPRTKVFALQGS